MSSRLQLKAKPHSSSTAIYHDSVFETGQITLHGNGSGNGIFIDTSQDLIVNLSNGITSSSGGLLVNGGVLIDNELYVDNDITTNGNIQIGTGTSEQILTMGTSGDAWRMKKINETIRWEKYNSGLGIWELMIRFSEC